MKLIILFLLCISLVIDGASESNPNMMNGKIIKGDLVDEKTMTYMASISKLGVHFCGGSLIGLNLILTAGHCVLKMLPNRDGYKKFKIMTGSIYTNNSGDIHDILHAMTYKDSEYEAEDDHDIGLVQIRGQIIVSSTTNVIPIASKMPVFGSTVRVAGWGLTEPIDTKDPRHNEKLSKVLNVVKLTIWDNTVCKVHYMKPDLSHIAIKDYHICAIGLHTGENVGLKDNGGPLVYDDMVLGITSVFVPSAPGIPGIYAKVPFYYDYLKAAIPFFESVIRRKKRCDFANPEFEYENPGSEKKKKKNDFNPSEKLRSTSLEKESRSSSYQIVKLGEPLNQRCESENQELENLSQKSPSEASTSSSQNLNSQIQLYNPHPTSSNSEYSSSYSEAECKNDESKFEIDDFEPAGSISHSSSDSEASDVLSDSEDIPPECEPSKYAFLRQGSEFKKMKSEMESLKFF